MVFNIRKIQNKFCLDSLSEILGVDYRSLALVRVVMSIILIIDLSMRATDLTAHYTDLGVLQRFDEVNAVANQFFISFHLANGSELFQIILFAINIALAFLLLVGYRTRITTILLFLFTVSLHARNPLILNGGDDILRLFLFWSIFLPLGAIWSIDSALDTAKRPEGKYHFSVASFGLILQVVIIYLATFLFKTHPVWTEDYSAVHYILNAEIFVSSLGLVLAKNEAIFPFLTVSSLGLELIGPFLIFVPWFNKYWKIVVSSSFILMHLGFALFMALGLFPYISMMSWLIFIPAVFWDKLSGFGNRIVPGNLVLYCEKGPSSTYKIALLLCSFLSFRNLEIKEVTPNKAEELGVKEHRQIFVLENNTGKSYYGFDAIKMLVKISPLTAVLLFWLPKSVRQFIVSEICEFIRYTKTFVVFAISKLQFKQNRYILTKFASVLAGISIIYIIFWNMGTLGIRFESMKPFATGPSFLYIPGHSLHLYQIWNLFAPYPIMDDGWYVIEGELVSGPKVDVYNNVIGEVDWDKPDVVSSTYKNNRWRKYLTSIRRKSDTTQMENYAQYLCRDWNSSQTDGNQLNRFDIYFMLELSKPPDEPVGEIVKTPLWSHWCFVVPNTISD
ncbi:MAG: hypothetical protein CL768_00530 [Chloroflexi bacterium]|nr:hypothetical protein [Chloroflexota bacterium]